MIVEKRDQYLKALVLIGGLVVAELWALVLGGQSKNMSGACYDGETKNWVLVRQAVCNNVSLRLDLEPGIWETKIELTSAPYKYNDAPDL